MFKVGFLSLCFLLVAPHSHHPGDGRLPGEAARGRERALHTAANAGLPGEGAINQNCTFEFRKVGVEGGNFLSINNDKPPGSDNLDGKLQRIIADDIATSSI